MKIALAQGNVSKIHILLEYEKHYIALRDSTEHSLCFFHDLGMKTKQL